MAGTESPLQSFLICVSAQTPEFSDLMLKVISKV